MAVTLSWGGPGTFPQRYEAGRRQLEETFGVELVAAPHALRSAEWIDRHPEARAEDLMAAFEDPQIRAIISSIGGDDSIRILPHLDLDVLRKNPKIFLGYSDTTVTHLACFQAGLVSFYGPAIMAGFAENGGLHSYFVDSVRRTLFQADAIGQLHPNTDGWTAEFLDWGEPTYQERPRKLRPSTGWNFVQGEGTVTGPLLGGCFDVLEFLLGTPVWPSLDRWRGAVLFLETSEEGPPPERVVRFLRNLRAQGILEGLAGILFARPGGGIDPKDFPNFDDGLRRVVAQEMGREDLPIVTGLDFGHTDPMFVVPYGVPCQIDCEAETLSIPTNAVE